MTVPLVWCVKHILTCAGSELAFCAQRRRSQGELVTRQKRKLYNEIYHVPAVRRPCPGVHRAPVKPCAHPCVMRLCAAYFLRGRALGRVCGCALGRALYLACLYFSLHVILGLIVCLPYGFAYNCRAKGGPCRPGVHDAGVGQRARSRAAGRAAHLLRAPVRMSKQRVTEDLHGGPPTRTRSRVGCISYWDARAPRRTWRTSRPSTRRSRRSTTSALRSRTSRSSSWGATRCAAPCRRLRAAPSQ
jgi:hypothetical protein